MSDINRNLNRWYSLKPHPVQLSLINDDVRFKVVPAGRRSGKTERAKRFIIREALNNADNRYFIAAPTRGQVKQIYWYDIKQLSFADAYGDKLISESELTVRFPNNSSITLIGLDQPQRIEGVLWAGGIVDEIADVKESAWQEHISPALDTFDPRKPTYKPWCWLIGVPNGLNHYYDLAEYAKNSNDPEWKLYTWFSADILPEKTIMAAKQRMSLRQYRQEYEASFEAAEGKIYEDYSLSNHSNEIIQSHEQLLWMHDFNFTPMSSAVGVIRNDNDLHLLDEIVLTSAIAQQSAIEFCDRYKNHKNKSIKLFGDPAGRAGEKHGHSSDYIEIEKILRSNDWKVTRCVKNAAPAIRNRQNAVRAKIKNAAGDTSLFINSQKAPYCHKGLATGQVKKGSTFLEADSEYQHITTAIGYCIDYIWPITINKETAQVRPKPSLNFYNRVK